MVAKRGQIDEVYGDISARLAAIEAQIDAPRDIPNPIEWSEDVSRTKLDIWQGEYLLDSSQEVLFNCSRQVGKSQSVSLKSAYRAKFLHRYVVVLAPTLRQSSVIYRRSKLWLMRDDTEFIRATAIELEMASGGSFAALPGDRPDLSIRGDTVDDLIVDEASRVKDELIAAATPATATRPDATITYLSTPAGKRGAFYTAWEREDWWVRITVMAEQCPRISAEFLARERRRLGYLYEQEYECKFLDVAGGLFLSADLDAVFGSNSIVGFESPTEIPEVEPIW